MFAEAFRRTDGNYSLQEILEAAFYRALNRAEFELWQKATS